MRILLLGLFILLTQNVHSQTETIVEGKVIDLKTGEPVTGARVTFQGTSDYTITNFDGNFKLKTKKESDSLEIYYIGYNSKNIFITRGIKQQVTIQLETKERLFRTVKTINKVDLAKKIIEKAQDNKDKYNFEKLQSFECESFTKIQIAVNNVSDDLKNKRLLKSVESVFDTMSYLSEDKNKQVLPIFISENLSNFYYNKSPRLNKEVIIASRVKGIICEAVKGALNFHRYSAP